MFQADGITISMAGEIEEEAQIINSGMATCRLVSSPARKKRNTDGETNYSVFGYYISITNNGYNYSEEVPLLVYDSRCLNCSALDLTCTKKVEWKLCPMRIRL